MKEQNLGKNISLSRIFWVFPCLLTNFHHIAMIDFSHHCHTYSGRLSPLLSRILMMIIQWYFVCIPSVSLASEIILLLSLLNHPNTENTLNAPRKSVDVYLWSHLPVQHIQQYPFQLMAHWQPSTFCWHGYAQHDCPMRLRLCWTVWNSSLHNHCWKKIDKLLMLDVNVFFK